jgi:spoIIIJ-associated protein
MKIIEEQGKTVDDAINKALEQLQVNRDQVSVEILEEGSRGFFGIMGAKPAKVRVSVSQKDTYNTIKEELKSVHKKDEPLYQENRRAEEPSENKAPREKALNEENVQAIVSTAKKALQVILGQLDVEYTVEVKRREEQILLNIHCNNENFLIGRRGTTLDAIQYLVNRIANKQVEEKIQVVLDTSNYRVNRKQRLQRLALRLSRRVKMTGKPVTVAPMNPHDRRIIHLTLQDDPSVKTLSRGTGFLRRVIISSNKNSNRNRRK